MPKVGATYQNFSGVSRTGFTVFLKLANAILDIRITKVPFKAEMEYEDPTRIGA
jgi:hypothetical protein